MSSKALKGQGCSLYLQNQDKEPKFGSGIYQRPLTISKTRSRCQTLVRNLQHHPRPQIRTLRTWMFFVSSKSRWKARILNGSISNTSDYIQIKIKIPNPNQEHPASSKSPNEYLKDMEVLCTIKIKRREPKFETWVYQRTMTISIIINMPNPGQDLQHPPKPQMMT